MIFFQYYKEVFPGTGQFWKMEPHYYLSLSFFALFLFLALLKKAVNNFLLVLVVIILGGWSLLLYTEKPVHGYGMAENWNYLDEAQVHQIIVQENINNFNVMNLAYDTLAEVQKYLLRKDRITIDYYNYRNNNYLFVVAKSEDFLNDPAYEIKTFNPAKVIKTWKINEVYNLYLAKRL